MTSPGFQILHVDEHLAVVAKDAGLLTVPAHGDPCLVDRLEASLDRESFGRHRLLVVHRLDRQTSGLLVFARSPNVAAALAKLFATHTVEREYAAIVAGPVADDTGRLDGKLDGKRAITHYEVTARSETATRIVVRLETGKRNQIRRHFADLGHPILGDTRFRPDLAVRSDWPHERLALHARTLGFKHPVTKKELRLEAAVPHEFF